MDIGKKIEEVFEQMKKRPMLMDRFCELESMEQIYEFFHSVRGGYTKQEFYDYISDFLDELDKLAEGDSKEINDSDLNNVAGGAGGYQKALAGVLASMSLFPANPVGLHAAENNQNTTVVESKTEENSKAEENKDKKEEKKKSRFFSKVKKFIFRNKGKIVLSIAAVILTALVIKNRGAVKNWMNENVISSIKDMFGAKNKVDVPGIGPIESGLKGEERTRAINEAAIRKAQEVTNQQWQSAYPERNIGQARENEEYKKMFIKNLNDQSISSLESEYDKNDTKRWYHKIPVVCGIAGLLGMSQQVLIDFSDCVKFFSKLQNSIVNLISPYGIFGHVLNMNKVDVDPVEPVKSDSNLKKAFKEIKGQEKAKKQLRGAISQIIISKYSKFKNNEDYNKADVFYFIGPSGVGKTFMAVKLCEHKVITNDDQPYIVSSGDVDTKSKDTIIEQIFGPKVSDYSYDGNKKTKSSLYSYIKNHPSGVVVFDEYDKFSNKSLDEFFRTAMDKGKVIVAGQELDCSGVTFILTSNESKKSLNISGGNTEREKDASITNKEHDQSFTNRMHVIEFEKLFEDNYVDIARVDLYEEVKKMFAQKEMGGINVTMSKETLERIADKAVKYGKGARYIKLDLLGEAVQALTAFLFNTSNGKIKRFKGKTIELVYKLLDATEEESKYDAPNDTEGKLYVKDGDKYKRWGFEVILKD